MTGLDLCTVVTSVTLVLTFVSFPAALSHPYPPLLSSINSFPLYFHAVRQCQMVVATHRVARNTLALDPMLSESHHNSGHQPIVDEFKNII